MRKLATYHDYTTLYYVGLSMMLLTTLSEYKLKHWSNKKILITVFIFMFGSLVANLYKMKPIAQTINHQADDFNKIRKRIKEKVNVPVFYFEGDDPKGGNSFIYGTPQAQDLYVTGYPIASKKKLANVIIHWK